MWAKAQIAKLDQYYPPCGPCGFCGHRDARHRLWDAILDRRAAGESIAFLAKDYRLSVAAIKQVIHIRPYHR